MPQSLAPPFPRRTVLVKEVSQRHDWLGGPINGDWFEAYVTRVLVPELRPGDIVITHVCGEDRPNPLHHCRTVSGQRPITASDELKCRNWLAGLRGRGMARRYRESPDSIMPLALTVPSTDIRN